jgi:hypothetical protein
MPYTEVIPIYDTARQEKLEQVIRYYTIADVVNGREVDRLRVEWWAKDGVRDYAENDSGELVLVGERGHFVVPGTVEVDGEETEVAGKGVWGRLPWIEIRANRERKPLLNRIKSLQDAYNLLSSKLTNDEIDLVALFGLFRGTAEKRLPRFGRNWS